jgi:hypothetical protein
MRGTQWNATVDFPNTTGLLLGWRRELGAAVWSSRGVDAALSKSAGRSNEHALIDDRGFPRGAVPEHHQLNLPLFPICHPHNPTPNCKSVKMDVFIEVQK